MSDATIASSTKMIDGRSWRTPLTGKAPARAGAARLIEKHQRGLYYYEGVGGFEFWQSNYWLPVTLLQRRNGRAWKTWMVDDPLHWHGMREAVDRLPDGRILVAGLGLGLMLHHMAEQPRFSAITVVDIDPDVRALIEPTLPVDPRVEIVTADFYRYIDDVRPEVDGILWDLGVGSPRETIADFWRSTLMCAEMLPTAELVQFGKRTTPRPEWLEAMVTR